MYKPICVSLAVSPGAGLMLILAANGSAVVMSKLAGQVTAGGAQGLATKKVPLVLFASIRDSV